MDINVSEANSRKISGEYNGYRYELMQLLSENAFLYKLTSPMNVSRLVTLDAEAVTLLARDPETFWKTKIGS